ncbi:tetratricopeptide repeat protein [Desulfopila aestuarii]|uniref:Ancillary SecYEG translocon subunit/Cell division coordinator CpoB TPR domain-containing protein n=1 Tax=Desulfopila aestuarii DSM 18488 TaxID=1121416 RepID=A0A1M7YBX6_9BACT|nr:tetratricopeptide repeat protein [Desulfopila aestuarii]SHO50113.1 hypothetical protein SAMN02745220_03259 [Desulfopila aestuarii DSM 18488]
MSGESAFEKRYVDPKDQSKIEGILELFNLPPKVIAFLRNYKRPIQVGLVVVTLVVVAGSLYKSYRERQIEDGASALALALQETGSAQADALNNVAEKYISTPSGRWAKVELAHMAMAERKFADASIAYGAIHKELKKSNPLFPLTLYGMAQAEEAQGNGDAAYAYFDELKDVPGYELTGYTGMARILEAKGELDKALGIYGQYVAVLGVAPENAGQKALVDAKIARLKARQ